MELKEQLGANFPSRLDIIEQEAGTLWKKGELYHVYYTLHGIDHSNSVIEILEKLIDGLNPADELNKTEIFCLLSAAFLHDVGMLKKYPDDEERAAKKSELKKRPYSVQDLIRDEHHLRSGLYITEHAKELKLDHREADCIRLIVEGHRQINLESDDYEDRPIGLKPVRIRLLSALLRLADELDLLPERAPGTLLDILENDMPDYSRIHWLKHYYTSGLLIETSESGKGRKKTSIEIHCQYPNE